MPISVSASVFYQMHVINREVDNVAWQSHLLTVLLVLLYYPCYVF